MHWEKCTLENLNEKQQKRKKVRISVDTILPSNNIMKHKKTEFIQFFYVQESKSKLCTHFFTLRLCMNNLKARKTRLNVHNIRKLVYALYNSMQLYLSH